MFHNDRRQDYISKSIFIYPQHHHYYTHGKRQMAIIVPYSIERKVKLRSIVYSVSIRGAGTKEVTVN